jgi:hypothetical protein
MSFAIAGIALTAVQGFMSYQAEMQAAEAAQQAAEAQAQVMEYNMTIAQQDRIQNIRLSEQESDDEARRGRRELARIRAAYGASGVELSGSPLEVLESSAIDQALDVRRVDYEGKTRARRDAQSVLGYKNESIMKRAEGRNAMKAGRMKAYGQLLKAGTSVAGDLNAMSGG